MRHHSMRITLTMMALALAAACEDGDDVSLGDDGQDQLCGGAMDAEGYSDPDDPNCQPDTGLGVKWDGTQCYAIAGCECVGDDCDRLYDSFEACQADCQQACSSSDTPTPCPDGMYCQAPNNGCGAGYCTATPVDCQRGGNPVCGCDGVTYDDICDLWEAGVAVAEFNACTQ
jgi:hypothetical protein